MSSCAWNDLTIFQLVCWYMQLEMRENAKPCAAAICGTRGDESYVMMQWKCDVHAVLPSFEQEWEQRDELNAL